MKRKAIILVMVLSLLLSGCSVLFPGHSFQELIGGMYDVELEYTRPDMAQLEQILADSCADALEQTNFDRLADSIFAYYEVYDTFYTNYNLAYIHYCCDLTDIYWSEEYAYCSEQAATVDAGLEELYRSLAQSPLRAELEKEENFGPGFFDSYEGDSFYDETLMELMERESDLLTRYYELAEAALEDEYYSEEYFANNYDGLAQLYVELIALRQQIAEYVGYDSYADFAYEFYYYRDYTPLQAQEYCLQIAEQFADIYLTANESDSWLWASGYSSENEALNYVQGVAEAMGGSVADAFRDMEQYGARHVAYGENKMAGAFEVYLTDYNMPYIYMSPVLDQTDKLTLVHEFGHFVNDYVCYGSVCGTDVAEVHSQAMEYLSLCYGSDTQRLREYKVADCVCTYVELAAMALFEQKVYEIPAGELTADRVQQLYEEICLDFGFENWDWDKRSFITIEHFYTNPMYVISYVVSNDLAFQIYQLELESKGAGLEVYEQCVQSNETYLMTFAETYGLESPFAEGRLEAVCQTLRQLLED